MGNGFAGVMGNPGREQGAALIYGDVGCFPFGKLLGEGSTGLLPPCGSFLPFESQGCIPDVSFLELVFPGCKALWRSSGRAEPSKPMELTWGSLSPAALMGVS